VLDTHKCAYGSRDNVGLVRFGTTVKTEFDFNSEALWWTKLAFTVMENGVEVPYLSRKDLKLETNTVGGLWEAWDMMANMPKASYVTDIGQRLERRREVILITDGWFKCKKEGDKFCRPCDAKWKDETLIRMELAAAKTRIIWKSDRQRMSGTFDKTKKQLADDTWFGCLGIDFEDPTELILLENLASDAVRNELMGNNVCLSLDN